MKQVMIFLGSLLAPFYVFACSGEYEATHHADSFAIGTIVSSEPIADASGIAAVSYQASISRVFYGTMDTNIIVSSVKRPPAGMSVLSKDILQKDSPCIVYMWRSKDNSLSWTLQKAGQKDNELLARIADYRRDFEKFLSEKEDLSAASPIELKMDSIIIPEVDLRCANINDVIDLFNKMSIEFDKSSTLNNERGVKIILKSPSVDVNLIHYCAKNASLLKNLKILERLTSCKYTITNGVVEVRREAKEKQGQP